MKGAVYTAFFICNLQMGPISLSNVPGRFLQPSLMCVGEAMRIPQSSLPKRCLTLVGSGLTLKHYYAGKAYQEQTLYLFRPIKVTALDYFTTVMITTVKF
jgi:hypothetical protein